MPDRSKLIPALLGVSIASNFGLALFVSSLNRKVDNAVQALAAEERAVRFVEAARRHAPDAPEPVAKPRSPISAEQFAAQWQAHYEASAAVKCWQPHFGRYTELPGHLDLKLEIAPNGTPASIELAGYKNETDAPDAALAQAVFGCVSQLLRAARYPEHPEAYTVQGRVTRPNPPSRVAAVPPEKLPH